MFFSDNELYLSKELILLFSTIIFKDNKKIHLDFRYNY